MLRRVTKKTLAVFLIFVLTIADFALVTKSYASTIFGSVFSSLGNTESKNVEFDAYFTDAEKERSYSAISRVCERISLYLSVSVSEIGYLKSSKISLKPYNNEKLSFEVDSKNDEKYINYIKDFKNNTLELKQINNNSSITVKLDLVFKQEEYININKLNNNFLVEFSGIYVNENGEEVEITRTGQLNIEWQDIRKLDIESEVVKYIPYNIEESKRSNSSNTCNSKLKRRKMRSG